MNKTAKKSWSPGIILWLLVAGLFLVGIAFFLAEVDRITLRHILYRLDFHNWPFTLGVVLWLLFVWLVLDALAFRYQTAITPDFYSGIIFAKWVALISIPIFLVRSFFTWLEIYFSVLVPYYFEPMTMFFYDGTVTAKLIFPPLTAIAAIGFLLYINHTLKKRDAK